MTSDTIAAINHNIMLNNQKMWLVALSRHRSGFTAFVKNKNELKPKLPKNNTEQIEIMMNSSRN